MLDSQRLHGNVARHPEGGEREKESQFAIPGVNSGQQQGCGFSSLHQRKRVARVDFSTFTSAPFGKAKPSGKGLRLEHRRFNRRSCNRTR